MDVSGLLDTETFLAGIDQLTTAVDALFFAVIALLALTAFLTVLALRR